MTSDGINLGDMKTKSVFVGATGADIFFPWNDRLRVQAYWSVRKRGRRRSLDDVSIGRTVLRLGSEQ